MVFAIFFHGSRDADAESRADRQAPWIASFCCFGLSSELMMLEGNAPLAHLKKLRNFQLCGETVYR
jgi:hypothetical protein